MYRVSFGLKKCIKRPRKPSRFEFQIYRLKYPFFRVRKRLANIIHMCFMLLDGKYYTTLCP